MKIDGTPYRSIWSAVDGAAAEIIDQTKLPFAFVTKRLDTVDAAAEAIRVMRVRGAPLIGVTAAYGMAMAMRADPSDDNLALAFDTLIAHAPHGGQPALGAGGCAGSLAANARGRRATRRLSRGAERSPTRTSRLTAAIGQHGLDIIRQLGKNGTVNVLTHCNAGWLATVDWGTATSPIYQAHDAGSPCMSGWMRPARATRARSSPRGNSASTACRIR